MSIAFVNSTTGRSEGAVNATTTAANMVGANGLICAVTSDNSSGTQGVSDSSSNTWTPLTELIIGASSLQFFYVLNPTVTATHTFSTVNSLYAAIIAMGFSGVGLFDAQNTGEAVTSSVQPGSVTPAEDNELFITAISGDAPMTGMAINSSFTGLINVAFRSSLNYELGMAYKIQATAGAENPTWSGYAAQASGAIIAAFKQAAADQPMARRGLWIPGMNMNALGGPLP